MACTACAVGRYTPTNTSASCTSCATPRTTNGEGDVSCLSCMPPTTPTNVSATNVALSLPPPQCINVNTRHSLTLPPYLSGINTYYLASTVAGRTGIGTWGFDKEEREHCVKDNLGHGNACCQCPEGATCPTSSSVETIITNRRYYRHDKATAQVQICPFKLACVGGNITRDPCSEGSEGPLHTGHSSPTSPATRNTLPATMR